MAHRKSNKVDTKSIIIIICAVFMVITLIAGVAALMLRDKKPKKEQESVETVSPVEDESKENEDSSSEKQQESEEPEEDTEPQKVVFNKPTNMKGVYLNPGEEFTATASQDEITAKIDAAVNKAVEFDMNTLVVDLFTKDGTVFQLDNVRSASSFDTLGYIVEKAKENGLFTYCIYDLSALAQDDIIVYTENIPDNINKGILKPLKSFAESYDIDAVMLKGYYNPKTTTAYSDYVSNGGGEGLDNYLHMASEGLVLGAKEVIKKANPSIQVGLLTEHPWANTSENEQGSKTITAFTSHYDGNADTKKFIEKGYFDFLAVEAFGAIGDKTENFEVITQWWNELAEANEIPMYVVHASSKAVSQEAGWNSPDQLTRQALKIKEFASVEGSMFNSLNRLIENPSGATTNLLEFYQDKLKPEHILKELALTSPKSLTGTTYEKQITFNGASDPNFDVLFNGTKLETDQNGYFTITKDLKVGVNEFKIEHKGKTLIYKYTRAVQVLKDASPSGTLNVDGGMTVTISATAYEDANVYAVINGQTVPMQINDKIEGDVIGDTSFKTFEGTFKAPEATTNAQKLGNIMVYAKWGDVSESKQGALVTVNKKPVLEDGVMVRVTASQAETFPTDKLNDNSNPKYYPLPQGTVDYTVGDEMVFKTVVEGESRTYKYFNLSSGLRVYSKDITPISEKDLGDNTIKGMTVTANKQFTDVIFDTVQKVPFVAKYDGKTFNITFQYTEKVPKGMSLSKNPLFDDASWSGTTLKLSLRSSGVFLGYRAFYDSNDNLVFRFNNPMTVSSGARITIDPGHDTSDPGSLGFNPNLPEQYINWEIGKYLADELQDRGANVNLIQSGKKKYSLQQRLDSAKQHNSILFMSIHNNFSSSDAKGTEVYYFNDYSKNLAVTASKLASSALETTNRGGKFGYFYVTRDTQFPSTLVECGFISNKGEYNKLKDEDYQQQIAEGLADSIENFLKSLASNTGMTGTESSGTTVDVGDVPEQPKEEEVPEEKPNTGDKDVKLEDMYFDNDNIKLDVGEKTRLKLVFKPSNAFNKDVVFKSDDKKVATVDSDGTIQAVGAGSCKITAISDDGDFRDYCSVTVSKSSSSSGDGRVTGVNFKDRKITIAEDQTYQLEWEFSPAKVDDDKVYFDSSNEKVVSVDKSGVVTGKRFGEATITITTRDGDYTDTCVVTVSDEEVEPSGVRILDENFIMEEGSTRTIKFEVLPETAADKGVEFESDDTRVCSVDNYGKVRASKAGTAKITVITDVGQHKDTIYVTVKNHMTKVTGVELDKTSLSMEKGEKARLTATISPSNADEKGIEWKSEDESIVKVNSDGTIEAVGEGTAEILVITIDGKKKAYCTVTVN